MRRGDDDELDVRVGEGLIDVCITPDAGAALRNGLRTQPGVAGDDSVQPQPVLTAHERAVKRPAGKAVSDHNGRDHFVQRPLWLDFWFERTH